MKTLAALLFSLCLAAAQTPPAQTPPAAAQPAPAQQSNAPETEARDAGITFQSRVNLVLVPVVVRDKNGKPIANLTQKDFKLFDKGKPQSIMKFSVEHAGARTITKIQQLDRTPDEKAADEKDPGVTVADHYSIWLFDDVATKFGEWVYVRNAATTAISKLTPSDRVAINTTSGTVTLDFTADQELLRQTLARINPKPVRTGIQDCPDISYYMADLIVNKNDTMATSAATAEANSCPGASGIAQQAAAEVTRAAQMELTDGDRETRLDIFGLKDAVRRLSGMPGQRSVVFSSPGFLVLDQHRPEFTAVLEDAIKRNVTIGALDARGLYTSMPDISRRSVNIQAEIAKRQYESAAQMENSATLGELADGTGGNHFQNSNDINKGFELLATTPEVYYILGFSPQNLKLDGSYHTLKVSLVTPAGMNVKARRGYFAPRKLSSADDQAKEEISEALFSREEMRDIPVELHTQFYKTSDVKAHLVLLARVDVKKLKFRKQDGRNANEVVVVTGLFDKNGRYLQGVSKLLTMRLKEDTLEKRVTTGITVRSDFEVTSGTYIVRLVVRDAEGQTMTAQNGALDIP